MPRKKYPHPREFEFHSDLGAPRRVWLRRIDWREDGTGVFRFRTRFDVAGVTILGYTLRADVVACSAKLVRCMACGTNALYFIPPRHTVRCWKCRTRMATVTAHRPYLA